MRKKFFTLFAASLLAATAVSARTVTVTDTLGRQRPIRLPVERVVALTSDALEAVRILRVEDRIVGISNALSNEPELWQDFLHLPVAGAWNAPSYERIAAIAPDLVLAYGRRPGPEMEAKLDALGIQSLRLDLYKLDTLHRDLLALAAVFDAEPAAKIFLKWHDGHMKRIKALCAAQTEQPAVYIEAYSPYKALGPNTGGGMLVAAAGGRNLAQEMAADYPAIDTEWLVARNPDLIVKTISALDTYGADNDQDLVRRRDRMMARPGWRLLQAVRDRRFYMLSADVAAGPRAVVGLAYLAVWFHPQLAAEVDPVKIHREYFDTFQRMPLKGCYAFPDRR